MSAAVPAVTAMMNSLGDVSSVGSLPAGVGVVAGGEAVGYAEEEGVDIGVFVGITGGVYVGVGVG